MRIVRYRPENRRGMVCGVRGTNRRPVRPPDGKPESERSPVENRFWSKIDYEDKTREECWEWKTEHAQTQDGYGCIELGDRREKAHRLAVALADGHTDPTRIDGVVRHTCHNPQCCNPAHLNVGTQRDNVRDSYGDGRVETTLTDTDVRRLRSAYEDGGVTQRELADRYNLGQDMISGIIQGEHYALVR